jgi:methionine aminotransferase
MVRGTDIVVLSDEVYEHILFDGAATPACARHASWRSAASWFRASARPTTSPAGRSATCVGPAALMAEFRKVHQFNVFTVHTPSQLALAEYMQDASRHLGLAAFYQEKRDFFRACWRDSVRACCPAAAPISSWRATGRFPTCPTAFAEWMTREVGVAVIPVSVFNADGRDDRVVRFCFAKKEETLERRR